MFSGLRFDVAGAIGLRFDVAGAIGLCFDEESVTI